jgi:hypothetical protein
MSIKITIDYYCLFDNNIDKYSFIFVVLMPLKSPKDS